MHSAEKTFIANKTLGISVETDQGIVAQSSMSDHATPNPKVVFGTRQSWDPELVKSRQKADQGAQAICDAAAVLFSEARPRNSLRLRVGISRMEADTKAHQIVTVDLKKPSGLTAVGEIWQKAMPSGSNLHQRKRFFSWQRADSSLREPYMENRVYNIQYVVTDASVLDICAEEIYAALIASMASSPRCSRLSLRLSGRGAEHQLVNDTFTILRTAFVAKELGTAADAVLCLL
ncbi:hypothetical protein S40288_11492 [Stachybotrys chartarum IBT 40288]|nr:hypothetical protein S40288_11492 [Stachybotrys chartarum IBT 40288]